MDYDENSFLAGLAVGRTLKGWAGGGIANVSPASAGTGIYIGEIQSPSSVGEKYKIYKVKLSAASALGLAQTIMNYIYTGFDGEFDTPFSTSVYYFRGYPFGFQMTYGNYVTSTAHLGYNASKTSSLESHAQVGGSYLSSYLDEGSSTWHCTLIMINAENFKFFKFFKDDHPEYHQSFCATRINSLVKGGISAFLLMNHLSTDESETSVTMRGIYDSSGPGAFDLNDNVTSGNAKLSIGLGLSDNQINAERDTSGPDNTLMLAPCYILPQKGLWMDPVLLDDIFYTQGKTLPDYFTLYDVEGVTFLQIDKSIALKLTEKSTNSSELS